ncbi:MAG: acetolactate synthase small subunit [Coriobacteriales bacterium]|jgi:acetolactate synthase-1/3 small subunit|nr:acetolactate synthase small subunit [Coriobacteriales bacterium]
MSEHTLSLLVDNQPGVLTRVTGLIARRGYNIESLSVDRTDDLAISRVTLVVGAEHTPLEQIKKQLHKLINVHKIYDLTNEDAIERELLLVRLRVSEKQRAEILEICKMFQAQIADANGDCLTIEASGNHERLAALEDMLRPYGIAEFARTGKIALSRCPTH